MVTLKNFLNYYYSSPTYFKVLFMFLTFLMLNSFTTQSSSFNNNFYLNKMNDSTWVKEKTWYQWKRFNNLFIFKDSLYCTYSVNVYETNLLVKRDSIHYYQWFPIYNAPFIKVFQTENVIEAWTSKGYMRTNNLVDWVEFPNPDNDLSWSAVKWKNYTVWGLEEFGRSGVIYINDSTYIFEMIVPYVDVFALGTDDRGYLYAALKNNIIYKKTDIQSDWQEYRAFPYNVGKIRLIKFFDDKEYVGSDFLYLNGSVILECVPSSIEYIDGVYYLSTYDKGMFISYDGLNFISWNEGIEDFNIWSIIFYNDFIYAATKDGIFKRKLIQ